LDIPIFALVEHMLQLAAGLISQILENPEENALLRSHLSEIHVAARTVEKIGRYDEDMAERLNVERKTHFEEDKAARQIIYLMRNRLKPNQIMWAIDYGLRCRLAVVTGGPIPKDRPPDA
jgi:phosphate uptake regulator